MRARILALGAAVVVVALGGGILVGPRVARAWREARLARLYAADTTLETARYTLRYAKVFEKRVASLASRADDVHDRVASFLGATWEGRIPVRVADLDGLAGHTLDRNILLQIADDESNAFVLGHETVHVYLNQICGGSLQRHRSATRLFNEGAASYVETHALGKNVAPLRMIAASYAAKAPVRLDPLLAGQGALRDFGSQAAYPLGELFVAALVEIHGDAAIARLAQGLGRLDEAHLDEARFIEAGFAAAHLDFGAVTRRFDGLLEKAVSENQEALSRFPRLIGKVTRESGRLVVRFDPPTTLQGFMKVCRLRAVAAESSAKPQLHLDDDCAAEVGHFPDDRFEYQLCWAGLDGVTDICEPYVEARREPGSPDTRPSGGD